MDKWSSYYLKKTRNHIGNLISVVQINTNYHSMSGIHQADYQMAFDFYKDFGKFIDEVEKDLELQNGIRKSEIEYREELAKKQYDTDIMIKILKDEGYKIIKEY